MTMWHVLAIGLLGLSPATADPLLPVPEGCEAPLQPHVVFVGEVVNRDYRTVRFAIDRVRSGDPAPFGFDGDRIDVRYGLDAQYLDDGGTYLVSAVVHPDLGLLTSAVGDPIEDFGGDEVIGVSETDVDCPVFDETMRTLNIDGTTIDAGVLEPFFAAKPKVVAALVIPPAVALGAIFLLATFRLSLTGLFNSIFRPARR